MNKLKIFSKVSGTVMRAGGRAMLQCRKASPEILLIGGLVCGVAAVVTGIIATKKVMEDEEIRDIHDEIDDREAEIKEETDKETKRKLKKGLLRVYWRLVRKYARKYALPFALLLAAIILELMSHGVLKARYLASVAAYTALDESFKDYRSRIRDIAGEEAEQRFFDGTVDDIEIETTDEDGKPVKEKAKLQKKPKKNSPYEFDFNKLNAPLDATTNMQHNYFFLKAQQCIANDMLHARGHVFLNEILDLIGLPRTQEGAILGWLENGKGDGFVDFGFSDYYTDEMCDIQDGRLPTIHLNMNCDGIIYDKI